MTTNHADSTSPPPITVYIWKIAAVTGAGAFIAMLDSTVTNLAIESIRDSFGSTISMIQWIATGYLIALAISLPATGWLGNRFGYGRAWSVSLAVFTAGSALCALSPSPVFLIGSRIIQGLAAGIMVPAGQAILGSAAGPRQLGRVMGSIGLVVALGPAVGPAFGGILLEMTSWHSLFWINVPLGIATLLAARGLIPAGDISHDRPLDWKGLLLIGIGLPLLLYGATEVGSNELSVLTFLSAGLGIALSAGFILSSLTVDHPLIDLTLLRGKSFSTATFTTGLTGANMYGGLLLLPLFLQLNAGQDVLEAGFMLLAMGLGTAVALYFGGMLTDHYGAGPVTATGAVLLALTTLPFIFYSSFSITVLVGLLVGRGIGLALAQMPAYTAAYAAVNDDQMGDAATLVNIIQRIGGAMGAVGLVVILTQLGGRSNPKAYFWAFTALTLVSACTIVAGVLLQQYQKQDNSHHIVPPSPEEIEQTV